MQERPDPAIRRRRITRGRAIAAALSVGSAVALTTVIALGDEGGAGATSAPTQSPDRTTTTPRFGDPRFTGPGAADPYSDDDGGIPSGGSDQYSDPNSNGYSTGGGDGFVAPGGGQAPAPDTSSPHTSSRGS